MNALKRIGNTRNDIEWDTTVTDRSTGRFLRHIPISSVRWENIQYASTEMKALTRFGTGRNDIQYTEALFKIYPGGVDGFYSQNRTGIYDPYNIEMSGFSNRFGYFSVNGFDKNGYVVADAGNTDRSSVPIQRVWFLIEKIGAPGTPDDFIYDMLNYYNYIHFSTSTNEYVYSITNATKEEHNSTVDKVYVYPNTTPSSDKINMKTIIGISFS